MNRFVFLLAAALCLIPARSHAADTRKDFLKLIDHPRVPLAPQTEASPATNDLVYERFSFASDSRDRVPGILIKLADLHGRRPVVIVMHGTGGRKEDEIPLLQRLAEMGFVAVAIDGRYHGERAHEGKASYQNAIVRAWQGSGEHPFFYDTVWDIMRLVDYLDTRKDVDPKRIGLTGISKGGIETYLTAAVDRRIAAAAPFIGVQSFEWALQNNGWQGRIGTIQNAFDTIAKDEGVAHPDSAFVQKFYDRVVPKIYSEFDGPQMLPLIAPRPLLVINSDLDPHCPLPGVEECIAATQPAYHADKADDHLGVIIQKNSRHQVRPESEQAMIDWFVKWLKP
ncbi:MAG TPA: dienelactone hydrolase family protein [Verrucomicrobiae bacterium]|jgi:dienelactone hydrolase